MSCECWVLGVGCLALNESVVFGFTAGTRPAHPTDSTGAMSPWRQVDLSPLLRTELVVCPGPWQAQAWAHLQPCRPAPHLFLHTVECQAESVCSLHLCGLSPAGLRTNAVWGCHGKRIVARADTYTCAAGCALDSAQRTGGVGCLTIDLLCCVSTWALPRPRRCTWHRSSRAWARHPGPSIRRFTRCALAPPASRSLPQCAGPATSSSPSPSSTSAR